MLFRQALTFLLLVPAVLSSKRSKGKGSKGNTNLVPDVPDVSYTYVELEATDVTIIPAEGVELLIDGSPGPGLITTPAPAVPTLVGSNTIVTGKCAEGGDMDCTFSESCTITKGRGDAQTITLEEQRCLLNICGTATGDCIDLEFAGPFAAGAVSIPLDNGNPDLASILALETGTAVFTIASGKGQYLFSKGQASVEQTGGKLKVTIAYITDPTFSNNNILWA